MGFRGKPLLAVDEALSALVERMDLTNVPAKTTRAPSQRRMFTDISGPWHCACSFIKSKLPAVPRRSAADGSGAEIGCARQNVLSTFVDAIGCLFVSSYTKGFLHKRSRIQGLSPLDGP